MHKYINEGQIKNCLLLLLSAIAVYYVFKIWKIFALINIIIKALIPILIGVFISFLVEPLVIRLIRLGLTRKCSCLFVYSGVMLLLISFLVYLIPLMISQLQGFLGYLPDLINYVDSFKNTAFIKTVTSLHLEQQMITIFEQCCGFIIENLTHFADSFIQFGIGAGAALFLSLDFKKVTACYYDLAPKNYRKEYWVISKRIGHNTFMFLRSTLYDTLIFFVLAILALSLFNFRYPLVFSTILAITNLIPYIGPYIGLIPLAISGFMISQTQGILAIFLSFGLQSIESNLICPILLKNMIYLHPVVGIFGISFFGSLFGLPGMIFSPLLMSIVKILYEEVVLKKIWLEKK